MTPSIYQWAIRHHVSIEALAELQVLFGLKADIATGDTGSSESAVQSRVRLEAASKGVRLWRNNVGALKDERGVPVRYGLANDSAAINKLIKSGDLIGIRPVLITSAHVGTTIGQFVSRECKREGWSFTSTDHERAQLRWIEVVTSMGGDAAFANGEGLL